MRQSKITFSQLEDFLLKPAIISVTKWIRLSSKNLFLVLQSKIRKRQSDYL